MPSPFEIESLENTGRTDNSGLDSLWVAWLSEPDRERERFLFSRLERHGVPSDDEMRELIARFAGGFDNYRGALDQFRERETPHGEPNQDRRAIVLPF